MAAQDSTGLVALVGSDKQVAWAKKIRDEFISWQAGQLTRSEKDLARELGGARPDQEAVDEYRQFVEADRTALDAARRQTSATFWIDTRSQSKVTVAQALRGKPMTLLGREIAPAF